MNKRNIIYWIVLTFALLSLTSCSFRKTHGIDNSHIIDTGEILRSYFKDQIEYKLSERDQTLLYCPDETCNEFMMMDNKDINALNDFVYLVFAYSNISNYPNMLEFKANQVPTHVDQVLKRNAADCALGGQFVKCVLMGMQSKYRIKSLFFRYDEKNKHVEEVDILQMISE